MLGVTSDDFMACFCLLLTEHSVGQVILDFPSWYDTSHDWHTLSLENAGAALSRDRTHCRLSSCIWGWPPHLLHAHQSCNPQKPLTSKQLPG
jgi:hypothetical protein